MWVESVVISFLALISLGWGQAPDEDGAIEFSMPELNEQEQHDRFMPDHFKCDSCRGIAYQLWDHFHKYNDKRKKLKYNLKESEIYDLVETTCKDRDLFNQYGIKDVNKVKHISGPGLEWEESPGIKAGGGMWPARMREMCQAYAGDLGENDIYESYKENPVDVKSLERFLCWRKDGACTKVSNKQAKREKEL